MSEGLRLALRQKPHDEKLLEKMLRAEDPAKVIRALHTALSDEIQEHETARRANKRIQDAYLTWKPLAERWSCGVCSAKSEWRSVNQWDIEYEPDSPLVKEAQAHMESVHGMQGWLNPDELLIERLVVTNPKDPVMGKVTHMPFWDLHTPGSGGRFEVPEREFNEKAGISGSPASPGIGLGRGVWCEPPWDQPFPLGAILLAKWTEPDALPIMRRASAIVTGEGGRLSHAATTAREMNIPCVVALDGGPERVRTLTGKTLVVGGTDGIVIQIP